MAATVDLLKEYGLLILAIVLMLGGISLMILAHYGIVI